MSHESTGSMDARELLVWLLGCYSIEQAHGVIREWLASHPRPRTIREIHTQIDHILAGLYQTSFDPEIAAPAVVILALDAERMVSEVVAATKLSPAWWLDEWLHEPNAGLGGQSPIRLLPDDLPRVRGAMADRQHGLRERIEKHLDIQREAGNNLRLRAARMELVRMLLPRQVIDALHPDATVWDIAGWFTEPNEHLDSRAPIELWPNDQEAVIAAARRTHWFERD